MTDKQNNSITPAPAAPQDPKLNVYCLSQFAFCPCAGLCAYEQDDPNAEDREQRPNMSYVPMYDRARLERQIQSAVRIACWSVLGGIAAAVALALLVRIMDWGPVLAVSIVVPPFVGFFVAGSFGFHAYVLYQYYRIHLAAKPRLPDPDCPKPQVLHWCELLANNVSLTRPKIPYDDWQCRLGGSPWRVLRFRDISIPVFRYHGDSDKLHRQHFVRMAAYCHLLEKREECRSPYGIVLWHGTYRAVTVPNNPYSRRMFRDVLSLARSCIRDSERDDPILPEPPPESFCWACPLGRPSEYEPGQYFLKHQHPMIPNKCRTPDGRQYHSHCGDRFGWIPPHERAVELDIELGTEAALAL